MSFFLDIFLNQAGSLQFGPDGKLYAVGSGGNSGDLFITNPSNGASSFVGNTGAEFSAITGLTLIGQVLCDVVTGELLPLDSSALFLAGIQSMTVWMIPTVLGLAGAGVYLVKFRKQ